MNPRIRGQLFAASTAPLPYAEADFDAGLQTLREVRLGCTVGRWASLKHHFANLELQTDISALIDQAIVEGVLSSQEHELGRLLLHFFSIVDTIYGLSYFCVQSRAGYIARAISFD